MKKDITTIIMAAGQGKRMKNPDKSKVMHELNGKPLIQYVIDLSVKINSDMIIPIVGHQKHSVIEFINTKFNEHIGKFNFAHQDEQLGTGHAVMQAENFLKDFEGYSLILSGDVPLLQYDTIMNFLDFHTVGKFDASLISAIMNDPSGYGRVLRDESGNFCGIKEDKDCNETEKMCKEINSGIYLIDNQLLFEALKTLKTDNAQGEYYLTDIFKYFKCGDKKIGAYPVNDILEITGINTIEQLEDLEKNNIS
jgi:UDP-N-acetylglucosamine diphosphorylase/glucosamine-1-phosphate N-acetyltransferase